MKDLIKRIIKLTIASVILIAIIQILGEIVDAAIQAGGF